MNENFTSALCHWCGEQAEETIEVDKDDSTGYTNYIAICHDKECIERTRRVLKMRGDKNEHPH